MAQELQTALSILEKAIRTELDGQEMYREAAERTTDPRGKQVFEDLIQEEQGHLQLLQKQFDSLRSTGKWAPMEKAGSGPASAPSPQIFPKGQRSIEATIPPAASDLDALKIAMEFERRGYAAYRKAAETSADPTAKAVYEYLAKEENRHYVVLEKTHTYLASNGVWSFYEIERPHFDGG